MTTHEAAHFDHDVERRLLSCLLIDPAQFPRVASGGLRTGHFHSLAHREVYQSAGALWESYGYFDAVTLVDFLKEQGTRDVVTVEYLGEILGAAATASSAPHYAGIVMRHAERREIIEAAESILEESRNGSTNVDIVRTATTRFGSIQQAYANRVMPVSAATYLTQSAPDVEPIIPGLLDKGDRHFIVSQSKAGKSWFALQQALCVASGLPFLEWDVPEPRRVAVCQFELKEAQYHKRVRKLAAALDLTPADLGGRLDIYNLRGAPFDVFDIGGEYDVLFLDPLYVMLAQAAADENSASDVGRVLSRISAWQRQTEAAVTTVHHATKGRIGDRQAVDRGAGSGVIGRDFDGMLTLAPARDDPEACLVVDHIARNCRPTDPFVIEFHDGYFQVRAGVAPVAETSLSATNRQKVAGPSDDEIAAELFEGITEPIPTEDMKARIQETYRVGINRAKRIIQVLERLGLKRAKTKEWGAKSILQPVDPQEWAP